MLVVELQECAQPAGRRYRVVFFFCDCHSVGVWSRVEMNDGLAHQVGDRQSVCDCLCLSTALGNVTRLS